jgi:phage major head subunit gpT-like protein
MAISPSVIEKGLNASFGAAMMRFLAARSMNPGLMALALMIRSTGAYEKLGWLGAMPIVQEWIGEANVKEFQDFNYTLRNKDWQVSVPMDENDWEDDQTGAFALIPDMLAERIGVHPEKLIVGLLTGGTSGLAYDAIAYFSDASGVRVNDNLAAGSGTTLAQIAADIDTNVATMAKFVDEAGEPLNIQPDTIVCPVALKPKFDRLVNSQMDPTAVAQGSYNPYGGKFKVFGDARLDAVDANDWYLLSSNQVVKPFAFSMRQTGRTRLVNKNLTKAWVGIADYRANAGYALPQLGIEVVN